VLVGIVFSPSNPTLEFYSDPILLEFVFGILIFRAWRQTRHEGPNATRLAVFATGIVLLVLQWERPLGDWRAFFWGVPAAAVLYGGLGALSFSSVLLARLGEWSYALYLTHVFVVTFYIKHAISSVYGLSLPWQMHYLIMTTACIGVAAAFHTLVERPSSLWVLRSLGGRRDPPPKPTGLGPHGVA
jgi:exopolysaccharide production protein ExoZ